jgi:hypothetical protein
MRRLRNPERAPQTDYEIKAQMRLLAKIVDISRVSAMSGLFPVMVFVQPIIASAAAFPALQRMMGVSLEWDETLIYLVAYQSSVGPDNARELRNWIASGRAQAVPMQIVDNVGAHRIRHYNRYDLPTREQLHLPFFVDALSELLTRWVWAHPSEDPEFVQGEEDFLAAHWARNLSPRTKKAIHAALTRLMYAMVPHAGGGIDTGSHFVIHKHADRYRLCLDDASEWGIREDPPDCTILSPDADWRDVLNQLQRLLQRLDLELSPRNADMYDWIDFSGRF